MTPSTKHPALNPFHLGEPLVAELLIAAGDRALDIEVWDVREGRAKSLRHFEQSQPSAILPKAHLRPLRLKSGDRNISFDGMHDVDCALLYPDHVRALELKLGATQMSADAFRARFVEDAEGERGGRRNQPYVSKHKRIGGSMVSFLDTNGSTRASRLSSVLEDGAFKLEVDDSEHTTSLPLLPEWILVVMRKTLKEWKENANDSRLDEQLGTQQLVGIVTLEDIAKPVGAKEAQRIAIEIVSNSVESWFPEASDKPDFIPPELDESGG